MSIGLVVAVAFGIEREAQRLLDQVSPNIPQVVQARAVLNPATGPATTFLILGSSRRPDQAPWLGNSDTMILVRLDPQHQLISMMSIPRDLQVAMPGYPGYQKIDAALSEGGPQLSIKVVQQVLGVPVNHYILVFWQGFFQMVQSIGGVYTEIDRRYYNPVGDSWTPIDLQPGYQLLNGNQALEYVRFRHLDTDIVREARQQRVLLDLREQATHRLGITDIPALLGVLGGSIQTDVHDVSTVLNLGEFLLNLPKGRIYHTTMDVSLGPSFVYADQAQISASVQRYLNPIVSGATTVASTSKAVPPRDVHVVVENANAGLLAAATVVGALRARGFDATSGGNAPPGLSDSTLYYTAAGAQAAQSLVGALAPVLLAPAQSGVVQGAPLILVIGPSFPVKHPFLHVAPARPAATGATTAASAASAGVVADPGLGASIVAAARHPGLRLLVPTRVTSSSSLAQVEGVRVYRIMSQGGGSWPAVNIAFQDGPSVLGQYWDVQETTMPSPPLLQEATRTVVQGGRTYELIDDAGNVRIVAFRQAGTWYWINNTLNDALSPAQMMAIAAGLKRA